MRDMLIVVIDDSASKIQYVKEGAKKIGGIKVEAFHSLRQAIDFIQRRRVDGIVTDMEFPVYEKNSESFDEKAGKLLIDWLSEEKKEVPVLLNSITAIQFKTDYPHYWGAMPGFFRMDIFYNFVSFIRDHD